MPNSKSKLANKGGRPTKYRPEMIPIIEEYIGLCCREQTELPTIEGLASRLGITSETVRDWQKTNKLFSSTIKKLMDKQKTQLMNDGMYGGKEVNAAMAIFLLKANHNLKDGGDTNVNIDAKILVLPDELISKYEITSNTENSSSRQS